MKGTRNMSRLLLLSHANLCESIYKTIELIMGEIDDRVSYITLPYGADINEYQEKIEKKAIDAKEDGILILTDLFGGSPFMTSSKVYRKLQAEVPIEIITGMNLPMIVEIMTNLDKPVSELKAIAIDTGYKGIVDFAKQMKKKEEGK